MNERIQELAKQSGMTEILSEHASEYGNGMFENTPYPELEKFAQLIVEECIVIMNREIDEEESKEKNRTISDMMDLLEQHFGVEDFAPKLLGSNDKADIVNTWRNNT